MAEETKPQNAAAAKIAQVVQQEKDMRVKHDEVEAEVKPEEPVKEEEKTA